MKQGLLTLAALSLTVAAALPASAQITGGTIRNIDQGTFNLAEAYPCTSGTYAATSGITPLGVFTGTCPAQTGAPAARALARAGWSVAVVEEGGAFTREDFVGPELDRLRLLYRDGGATVTLGSVYCWGVLALWASALHGEEGGPALSGWRAREEITSTAETAELAEKKH